MLPQGVRPVGESPRVTIEPRFAATPDERRAPSTTCQTSSREGEEREERDHRRQVGEQRDVEQVVRPAGQLRSVTASAPFLRSWLLAPGTSPARRTGRAAARGRSGRRRERVGELCELLLELRLALQGEAAHLQQRPAPSGAARTQTLRRERVERGEQAHDDEDSGERARPAPRRRCATWSTEYCRRSGNAIVEPEPVPPSGRAAPSARSAVRPAPTMPARDLLERSSYRGRFVARSPSTPAQTVKRMIGSNFTSIA